MKAPIPHNDKERIIQLKKYNILDSNPEKTFDDLTLLAKTIINVPISVISFVDTNRQWFLSCHGLDVRETNRDIAFCAYTIHETKPLIVENALEDERFKNNPLVTGPVNIRFYLGIPLIDSNNFCLGTLCLIDTQPRKVSAEQVDQIQLVANQILRTLELRKQNQELEKAKTELSSLAKLYMSQQEKVVKSLNEKNKAYELKNAFMANLSHEIRTPLNGIKGLLHLLEDTELSLEQYDYLKTIKTSSETLLFLINDILDFSKIESGKMELENADVNLSYDFEYIAKTIALGCKKNNNTFELENNLPKDFFIKGDSYRIKQVFLNIGSNANKFTSNGNIKMSVGTKTSEDKKLWLEVKISDTGIGMSEEAIQNLFQPFTQADNSITRKFGGTGLGLSIVKQIVNLMNGDISVSSLENLGTTFSVSIPLKVTNGSSVKNETCPVSINHKDVKILLAEDNEINQQVQKSILEKLGYQVTLAENGLVVLELLKTHSFDLILMDMQMPELDGMSCTKIIRTIDKVKDIPIIALTANSSIKDKDNCLASGMNNFISKPFDINILDNMISSLLPNKCQNANELQAGLPQETQIKILEMFVDLSASKFDKIKKAYDSGEFDKIKIEAHSLKSVSLYMGEPNLSKISEKLEQFLSEPKSREDLNILNAFLKEYRDSVKRASQVLSHKIKKN